MMRGRWLLDAGSDVGWDQRRFAAPAHQDSSTFRDGGPALEANLSHPTMKKLIALGVQSSMGGPPTKDCWASDFEKVALSLRDRKRDQQGGVDLPSHLGSTANATRVFSLPVAERQGYHQSATGPHDYGPFQNAETLTARVPWDWHINNCRSLFA